MLSVDGPVCAFLCGNLVPQWYLFVCSLADIAIQQSFFYLSLCGFLLIRVVYRTETVYAIVSLSRSQFACCDGYMQINGSLSCKPNITLPAVPLLDALNVTSDGPYSLSAIWSLSNHSNGSASFNASCTAIDGSHQVYYSVGMKFNATFSGLKAATHYKCCVWAVVVAGAGPATCDAPRQTQGLCDSFTNSSSCLNGTTCLKYYYNATIMNCICEICPNIYTSNEETGASGSDNSNNYRWAAPLVSTLGTIILVILVVLFIVVPTTLIICRKKRERYLKQGELKENVAPSYELSPQNANYSSGTEYENSVVAPSESEYSYASTPECALEKNIQAVKNIANENALNVNSKQGGKQHWSTESSSCLIKNDVPGVTTEDSEYSQLDHTEGGAKSHYNYERLAHCAFRNDSDIVHNALNEGAEKNPNLPGGHSILNGPPLLNRVNLSASDTRLEQPTNTNNPLYGAPVPNGAKTQNSANVESVNAPQSNPKPVNSKKYGPTESASCLIHEANSRVTAKERSQSDCTEEIGGSPDKYSRLVHHCTTDQEFIEPPDNYNTLVHFPANNDTGNVYSALHDNAEMHCKVNEDYGVLKGPLLVNAEKSAGMYSSTQEPDTKQQNIKNPVYRAHAPKETRIQK